MNDISMGSLNAMGGGPSGIHMMNNGNRPVQIINDQRSQLNTYIYEYFMRNGMYECAKALLESGQPINVKDNNTRRRDDLGNVEDGGEDHKDDYDQKRSLELPEPNIPKECPESCFLYEWWCLFWDMFNAQRGKSEGRTVLQYFHHTQAQSRSRQEHQQILLRGMRSEMNYPPGFNPMLRNQHNAGAITITPQNELRQKALQNNRNTTPAQMQMLQQQQKHQQMQRDPSAAGETHPRPPSPPSAENAPSPSKRPRLDGAGFTSRVQATGMPQQFQNIATAPNGGAAQRVAGYQASLGQQQQSQMPNVKTILNAGGPQSRGSPMMAQGQQEPANINTYYNSSEAGPNGIRAGPGGGQQQGNNSGNHALQDYQMQLMLLEQQNKKRLMMARQEQESLNPRPGANQAPQGAGPNGQSFQGTSPQGSRPMNSPNPGDQMKRTSNMNPSGMPSPLPEGQSRSSPGGNMNFNIQAAPMDPSINPQYFGGKVNGMDPNMVGNMSNGMRPPSSHPQNFNQLAASQAQLALAARQQNWQSGPNGQPMMTQPSQGQAGPQQSIGTPQQRNMPPPSMSTAGVNTSTNNRTPQATTSPGQTPAPPTPQQANKTNPKKKTEPKDNKLKRAQKKGSAANINPGATPSAEPETTGATPTPATPMTPIHKQRFNNGQNNNVQTATNGQVPAPSVNMSMTQQQDPLQGNGFGLNDTSFPNFETSLDFANPGNGNMDVLQDFDFDSFLHQDAGDAVNDFNFDASGFLDSNEIGAAD